MDIIAEFVVPPSASQVIESDSGTEDDKNNSIINSQSSPVFSRKIANSPIFKSKKICHERKVSTSETNKSPIHKRKLEWSNDNIRKVLKSDDSCLRNPFQAIGDDSELPCLSSWLVEQYSEDNV